MTRHFWNATLDYLIEQASPQSYQLYLRATAADADEADEAGSLAPAYHDLLLLALGAALLRQTFALPTGQLPLLATDLERVWQTIITDRDTTSLQGRDLEEDDHLVGELENLRDEADGLLAMLQAYAAGHVASAKDLNDTLRHVLTLADYDLDEAQAVFAGAGAAALRGAHYWPLWHTEASHPPVNGWFIGLASLVHLSRRLGLYPLAPIAEQRRIVKSAHFEPAEPTISPHQHAAIDLVLSGRVRPEPEQLAALHYTPEVIDSLADVLNNLAYEAEAAEGGGLGPRHAAYLLGQSASAQAVPPLLTALYGRPADDPLYSSVVSALTQLGPLALPATLESMRCSTDYDYKSALADVLGGVGRGDDRAFRALETFFVNTTWEDDRPRAVEALAALGDNRAMALLRKSLTDRDTTPTAIRHISSALRKLDPAHLPAELQALETAAIRRYDLNTVRFDKLGRAFCRDCSAPMRRAATGEWMHVDPEPASFRAGSKYAGVGRNDLCPCGSGKKFKHCHGSGQMSIN